MAILTADTPEFLTRWTDEPTVELPTEDQAKRVVAGQTFHAAFIVTGLTANDQDRYDCAVSWRFLRPDGSILFQQDNFARATGVLPKQPLWSLLDPAVDLKLDATDPPGHYRFVAEVVDRVSLGRATTAAVIELRR